MIFKRNNHQVKVLFVCMGNICRSPTAEGVFRHALEGAGLVDRVLVDSAGTISSHAGERADPRACDAATEHGYDLYGIRGRKVKARDFEKFDLILAMDGSNLKYLREACPEAHQEKLFLYLRDFAPQLDVDHVPDPYYGPKNGFDEVIRLVEAAAQGLLSHVEQMLLDQELADAEPEQAPAD